MDEQTEMEQGQETQSVAHEAQREQLISELREANKQLRKELTKDLDIDDMIDNFISILDFDQVIAWADLLDVDRELPPLDDMYPDWENELAVEIGEAMRKVGEKKS